MDKYFSLREKCYHANLELPKLELVVYTFGNVSAVDRDEGVFAIKPSGVPYEALEPKDIIIVDFDNNIIDGPLRPSSDTKTHALLYRKWEDIGGVVHTHSTYSVAWAQAQMDIPILGTTHADHIHCDIPCAPIMKDEMIHGDYEHETGNQILNLFKEKKLSYKEVEMMLIGGHGPFTWGRTVEKAVYNSKILEELAKMAYLAVTLNPKVTKLKETLIQKHYERKHGNDAYYGQG